MNRELGFLVVVGAVLLAGDAEAEPAKISVEADTSVWSTYVFRGVPQYSGTDIPSSQSTVSVAVGNLSVSVWNATALSAYSQHGGTQLELDLTVAYEFGIASDTALTVGYIGYFLPEADQVDGAHEVMADLSHDFGAVSAFVRAFPEFVRLKGAYGQVGVAREFARGDFAVEPSVAVGVAGYDGGSFGVNDATFGIGASYQVAAGIKANGWANYSYAPDLADPSSLFAGFGFGAAF